MAWALFSACSISIVSAAEIDAGAILNKYRQELTPGFLQLPTPAGDATQEMFHGFQIDNLPESAQQEAKEYVALQIGQEVIVKSLMAHLERHLQNLGHAYVFQRAEEQMAPGAPVKLKAFKVTFGRVIVNNNSGIDTDFAKRVLSYGIASGAPVDRAQLERNSTVLSEVEGITNNYQMKPGQQIGVTDLVAQLEPGRLYNGSVTLDNSGTETLGQATLRGDVALNNKLGRGDVLRAYGLLTQHSHMAGADASVLVDPSGWRLGVSYSEFSYGYGATNGSTGLATHFDGSSKNTGLSASYPLIRSEFGRHTFAANLDHARTLGDAVVGSSTQTNHLTDTTNDKWSLSVYGIQALGHNMSGSYQSVLTYGHARQNIASAALQDAGSSKQMGHYAKLFLSGSLSKGLTLGQQSFVGNLSASLQMANRNLPGSEKMYFGGMTQMRAWMPQAVPVDEAFYTEWKIDKQLTNQLRVGVFVEMAQYRQNHTNYMASVDNRSVATAATNTGQMADWGVSMLFQISPQWQVKGFVANKLTADPSVNTQALSDASRTRGWVSLTRVF